MRELTGQKFGNLLVVSFAELSKRNYLWNCVCDCGKTLKVSAYQLTRRGQKCCLACANARRAVTHGHCMNGGRSKLYSVWSSMCHRAGTTNPKYSYVYGHISVCDRWKNSFENFLADMGERPKGHSLERINNSGNYEPSNCRWATRAEQLANRRPYRKRKPDQIHPRPTKLDASQVREIRKRAAAGESQKSLTRAFGVADSHISNIVNRKSWAHLNP